MKVLVPLAVSLVLISCNPGEKSGEAKSPEALYNGSCGICHGKDGKLGQGGAKDLSISTLTLEERIKIIEYGKPGMTPFKGVMRDEDIRVVAEYLDVLKAP
jgi:mono/diheme cytochrome c family protein